MTWTIKQHSTGYFYAENDRGDHKSNEDGGITQWVAREEAEAWAKEADERHAQRMAEQKARIDARNARRQAEAAVTPTAETHRILTSRGDGWEGNGR